MLVYTALNLLKKGMAFREDKKKMKNSKKINDNDNYICTIYKYKHHQISSNLFFLFFFQTYHQMLN